MQVLPQPRSNDYSRVRKVDQELADLVIRFRGSEFEDVHPARWRHKESGHHVETGYSYGEGRVRVFLDGKREVDAEFILTGRPGELDDFNLLFPVSG